MSHPKGVPSRRVDSESVSRARRILRGEAVSAKEILNLTKELKAEKAFGLARKVLGLARDLPVQKHADRLKIAQQLALCTYKDPDLPADSRLDRALEILQECEDLNDTKEQETLGLAGAIFKRKWEVDTRKENLERSLSYYLRGFDQDPEKDFGYTGINAAYVLDLLAHLENTEARKAGIDSEVAQHRRGQAARIRERIVNILPGLPETPGKEYLRNEWWFYATLAEACYGLGRYQEAIDWIERGRGAGNVPAWEFESTATQLASLARIRSAIDMAAGNFAETDAGRVLRSLLGENIEGVLTAYLGKVGLALSGGGFRASFFHIGVLARLAELDVLRHVEVLSCVSGGSILGAHYYLEVRKLLKEKDEANITTQDYIDIVKRVQHEFLTGVQKNVRNRILAEFITNLKMVFLPGYSRTLRAGELFESLIYRRVEDGEESGPRWLTNLFIVPKGESATFSPKKDNWRRRAKVPDLILNATSLNTGHNWQFTASWMGEPPGSINTEIDGNYRLRRMYYWEAPHKYQWIRLGHAVAASACVPGLFEPLPFKGLYSGKTLRLVDGGVHDNQGIVGLLEQNCKVLFVSDASGQMDNQDDPSSGVLGVPLRANSILQTRVRESQYEDLRSGQRGGLLRSLMFVHLKKDLDVEPVDWLECQDPIEASDGARPASRRGPLTRYGMRKDVQRSLAAIRTDLDSFSSAEAYALMASGYRMTEYEFARRVEGFPLLGAKPQDWEFLKIEAELRNTTQAKKLRKLLDIAGERTFKAWRLSFPLKVVAVILAIVAGLGITWLVWTFSSTPLLTVGALGLAIAAIMLSVLIGKGVLKVLNLRSTIAKVAVGVVFAIVGPLLVRPYMWVFDRLYLWLGSLKRFGIEASAPVGKPMVTLQGDARD